MTRATMPGLRTSYLCSNRALQGGRRVGAGGSGHAFEGERLTDRGERRFRFVQPRGGRVEGLEHIDAAPAQSGQSVVQHVGGPGFRSWRVDSQSPFCVKGFGASSDHCSHLACHSVPAQSCVRSIDSLAHSFGFSPLRDTPPMLLREEKFLRGPITTSLQGIEVDTARQILGAKLH